MLRSLFKSFILITVCFGGGLVVAVLLILILEPILGDLDWAAAIGTVVWILGGLTALMFGSLYTEPVRYSPDVLAKSSIARSLKQRDEGRIQTAALRLGLVYAMCVGGMASALKLPVWAIVVLILVFGFLGGWVGHCFKRLAQSRTPKQDQEPDGPQW